MKDKNLLVLVPDYPDEHNKMIGSLFVKEQIGYLKDYFNKIYVIAPVLSAFGFTKQSKFCRNYSYDNVTVYFPRCLFYPRAINMFPVSNYTKLSYDNRYSVIRNTIKKYDLKFDLIHSHMTFPATYAACKLKEEYNVPVVATIHEDSGWLEEEIGMNHEKLNYSWKNADMLIRVNKVEVPLLQQFNKNVRYVPNGFTELYKPMDKILCRERLGLPINEKFVFSYGAFDERKGFQVLIKAMLYTKSIDSSIKCYLSGDGPYKSYLKNFVMGYNLEEQFKFIEYLEDDELALWINAADLFIFPSLRESFGVVQVNALACGTPVIASKNVGSKEIICNQCGFLYDLEDFPDLSNKIFLGLDTAWDREKIRNYAETNYSWKGISTQLIELYKDLL